MPAPRQNKRKTALAVTFCGMMAALGVALMLVGGVLAVFTYAAPMLASVCLIPVMIEFGRGRAWLCYIASAVLCALLCPDKELAFFYVAFGYYPIIRGYFQKLRPALLRFVLKLVYFLAVSAALYAFLILVLRLEALLNELSASAAWVNALLFFGLVFALMVYDAAVGFAEKLYIRRIRPKLRFLGAKDASLPD